MIQTLLHFLYYIHESEFCILCLLPIHICKQMSLFDGVFASVS